MLVVVVRVATIWAALVAILVAGDLIVGAYDSGERVLDWHLVFVGINVALAGALSTIALRARRLVAGSSKALNLWLITLLVFIAGPMASWTGFVLDLPALVLLTTSSAVVSARRGR